MKVTDDPEESVVIEDDEDGEEILVCMLTTAMKYMSPKRSMRRRDTDFTDFTY